MAQVAFSNAGKDDILQETAVNKSSKQCCHKNIRYVNL